ncbi:MAG TPA: CheR family methyltransferase [Steroidobacteraceae bacterium]|nr:CheR family methyltransferase [Steroidobacteraceae bacterium]
MDALHDSRAGPMISTDFPIVGIGASAGGLDAFHSFFAHMPVDCGMAFVMVLHLPADRKSMLIEILSRWTGMRVEEGADGTRILPNRVYVPPPHAVVTLVDGCLAVQMPPHDSERLFRPIDGFFDSLGAVLRERAVGIVLSGTGSDGSLGLKAIKECGGLTIAQGSGGTAPQYGEMPAGAIATGAVDLILPVDQMAAHLMRLKSARSDGAHYTGDAVSAEADRLQICEILREHLGHDFSGYRGQTFLRRVRRRMQVVSATTVADYIAILRKVPGEAAMLFRDLLIRVTSFFRDEETFEILASKVIPRLFNGKMADGSVRVWVPGCATGEEAYSLAMLLREHLDTLDITPRVQLFATDIDETAIATARVGRYPKTLLEGLSERRRQRFFTYTQGGYCVTKEIRDICTFSLHNLVRDPPFSTMSLISCRNLLIYMNSDLQARIVPLFHYSLAPGGMLLLGASESVAQHPGLFGTVDKAARIFERRGGRSPDLNVDWQRPHLPLRSDISGESPKAEACREPSHPPDAPTDPRIDVEVIRVGADRFRHLMGALPVSEDSVAQLQRAIVGASEELQSLTEKHQTALEELRSANEELHSVNEEVQSTNEELETSKEELQSLNEELHTVNLRLTEKIDELDRTNSDLRNLFESTEIATVFLDRHLIIRSFTPAIATVYNLIPSDQGRPLTDIVSRLRYDRLREDVAYVLSTLAPLERRVARVDESVHYIMRILPYREPDRTVSGVLVTFVDVTSIVRAEEALVEADARKDVFLATLAHELRNPLAPIRIAAQLLQLPNLEPDKLGRAQAIISRQVSHMTSLLDDLLDVSRITRGSFLLKRTYVEVRELMDDAVEAVQATMDAKHHTLRVEVPEVPVTLDVDSVRITQVITNLLTNAGKYTQAGGLVYLGTRLEQQHFVIFVRDNGVGLAPEALARIFDMFTRVDSEVGRAEGGLGIGLALAKGLVELHGGRLAVRSDGPNRGSEFMICLPRSLVVDAPAARPEQGGDGTGAAECRRILVADDNRDSAETLSMLLKAAGHEVHLAHTGGEAWDVSRRVRPDIGVFDIGMPDLSGYEVAERIRREAWGQQMILIAVTGWGQDSDKRRAFAAGFDHHLTKPVDPDQLKQLFGD